MKGSDKAVVLGVLMAVILGLFYFMVLGPKRDKASQLGKDVSSLQAQVSQERQVAQFGEDARSHFPAYYARLVVLGKAVPDGADTASLLVQLSAIARHTSVKFTGIALAASGGSSGAAASPSSSTSAPSSSGSTGSTGTSTTGTTSTSTTPAPSASGGSSSSASATATPASSSTSGSSSGATSGAASSAPATEASAANLPLGASVGPDNLAVMPYNLTFQGSYFQVADFLKGLDDLIHTRGSSQVGADGRLLTIDGFSLSEPMGTGPNPQLKVAVAVTSYVTPAGEGLTAGASPSGPAPSTGQPLTQPASAAVSAP